MSFLIPCHVVSEIKMWNDEENQLMLKNRFVTGDWNEGKLNEGISAGAYKLMFISVCILHVLSTIEIK
jgi:hypothetical protein